MLMHFLDPVKFPDPENVALEFRDLNHQEQVGRGGKFPVCSGKFAPAAHCPRGWGAPSQGSARPRASARALAPWGLRRRRPNPPSPETHTPRAAR